MAGKDEALERFDRPRVREVQAEDEDTASTFLARFQSTAASLGPEERVKLRAIYTHERSAEILEAVLVDPQAGKVCSLDWGCGGEEVVPLLLSNCPELASLEIKGPFAFDFVSSVLEHPSHKVKVLVMPRYTNGDLPRFFAALGQSQVSALTINGCDSAEFYLGLGDYLAKDLLVSLTVMDNKQVPLETMRSLAKCTRLAKLNAVCCEFSQPTVFAHLPKSVTKLVLRNCVFAGGFDWSFLAGSGVREMDFHDVSGVDGSQLGGALAVHVRAQGLDELRFDFCDFVNETLAATGVEIGRVKIVHLEDSYAEDSYVDDARIELIALVLQSPNSEIRELRLGYTDSTVSGIEDCLVPALKHPNCSLAKLGVWAREEHEAAAETVEHQFRHRHALFVLLQGQQVRRLYCPLRRLPVEMFRLVGEVLL